MKKFNRKTKVLSICLIVVILIVLVFGVVRIYRSRICPDIIGDGYIADGYGITTDPEPVVIGNICD